jgi:hypothetical protein
VIPSHAPALLDEVGLLRRENGQVVKRRYDNRGQTPYGGLSENLIY